MAAATKEETGGAPSESTPGLVEIQPFAPAAHEQASVDADPEEHSICLDCSAWLQVKTQGHELRDGFHWQSELNECESCSALRSIMQEATDNLFGSDPPQPGTTQWQRLALLYTRLSNSGAVAVAAQRLAAAWIASESRMPSARRSSLVRGSVAQDVSRVQSAGAPSAGALGTTGAGPREALGVATQPNSGVLVPAIAPSSSASQAAMNLLEMAANRADARSQRATTPSAASASTSQGAAAADDELMSDMPINPFSMNARLPSGGNYHAISRIRSTINRYTADLSDPRWSSSVNLATIQALRRRLSNHEMHIVGRAHVDLEIAYRQLLERVDMVIIIYQALKSWVDAQSDTALSVILKPVQRLAPFMSAIGREFGAEVCLLVAHAKFRQVFDSTARLDLAMDTIDYQALSNSAEVFINTPQPDGNNEMKEEPCDDDECEEVSRSTTQSKGGLTKKQTKKSPKVEAILRYLADRFTKPAKDQLARLTADGITSKLFLMPVDLQERPPVLASFLEELGGVAARWRSLTSSGADDEFAQFLNATKVLAECIMPEEGQRPPVEAVRAARQMFTELVRKTSPQGEVAKAFGTYNVGKSILAASVQHSRAGLEDEAATKIIEGSIDALEALLQGAFEDLVAWVLQGQGGAPQTSSSFKPLLEEVRMMFASMYGSVARWSAAALYDKREVLQTILHNCALVLDLGNGVLREASKMFITACMSPASDAASTSGSHRPLPDAPPALPESAALAPDGTALQQVAEECSEQIAPPQDHSSASGCEDINLVVVAGLVATALSSFESSTLAFMADLESASVGMHHCLDLLRQRLGDDFDENSESVSLLTAFDDKFGINKRSVGRLLSYMKSFKALGASGMPSTSPNTSIDSSGDSALCIFCKVHHEHCTGDIISIVPASVIHETCETPQVQALFTTFLQNFGQSLYDTVAMTTILHNLRIIIGPSNVALSLVHSEVLEETELQSTLQLLVRAPPMDDLGKLASSLSFCYLEGVEEQFATLEHNKSLDYLLAFAEAIGLPTIPFATVNPGMSSSQQLPLPQCALLLKITTVAKDICLIAAYMHTHLLTAGGKVFDGKFLCAPAANALATMRALLSRMDSYVNSPEALAIEKSGHPVDPPLPTHREWARLVAIWSSIVEVALLRQMCATLGDLTTQLKSSVPSWRAAFDDGGRLSEGVAFKLFANRFPPLLKANNAVHAMLVSMNMAAAALNINPKLKDHELTNEAIATALDTLRSAAVASTVMAGIDIIQKYRMEPSGANRAKDFLSKARTPENEAQIPVGFFDELSQMADMATLQNAGQKRAATGADGASPRPKSEAPSSGKKAKSEAAASTAAEHTGADEDEARSSSSVPTLCTSPAAKAPTTASPASGFKPLRRRP